MTREMAIEELKRHQNEFANDHGWSGSVLDALDMAIKSLQTKQLKESPENFNKDSETESMLNADLISRQEIIDRCETVIKHGVKDRDGCHGISAEMLLDFVKQLPSITPQKVGKWIPMTVSSGRDSWKCSVCGRRARGKIENLPYCHCGAKMEEGSKE